MKLVNNRSKLISKTLSEQELAASPEKGASYESKQQNTNNQYKNHSESTEEQNNVEDRLILLVKAAEKISEENSDRNSSKKNKTHNINKPANRNNSNFTTFNEFVNSTDSCEHNDQRAATLGSQGFPVFIGKNGKPTRPFKAYPKESLSVQVSNELSSSSTSLSSPPMSSSSPKPTNSNETTNDNLEPLNGLKKSDFLYFYTVVKRKRKLREIT